MTIATLANADKPSRSAELYARALDVMPGGCSRNTILRSPHPVYVASGSGCYLTDVDGRHYTDFGNNMASLIHGHAHPRVVEAVTAQLRKGSAFMMATEAELEFAEHMCARNANFEQIRFMNSGTEAVMSCIKVARAFTGRPKIAKVEGAYHGPYDYAEVSQTSSPANWGQPADPSSVAVAAGTPAGVLSDVVILPFNDAALARDILERHADEIACVLVDPVPHRVGLLPAGADYLETLREWTETNGALLVFDEVVTFRCGYGGAQEVLGAAPDLTAMGKAIGGGFPVGAVAGRREVMDVVNPLKKPLRVPQAGTFSANPVTMTAGRVSMELFDRGEVERLNALGETLRANLREAIAVAQAPLSVTGFASMFRIHPKPAAPGNYRETFTTAAESERLNRLLDLLLERGFAMINTGSGMLSTPMDQSTIAHLSQACLDVFRQLK